MAIKLSTGLRDHILATGDMQSGLDGGVIRIYGGTAPADADAAIGSATLLNTISNNGSGTGLTMDNTASGGVIGKNPAEGWKGTIAVSGTATFYRFSPLSDDFTLSTTIKRIQGTVSTVAADLVFSSTAFVAPNEKAIDSYLLAQPAA